MAGPLAPANVSQQSQLQTLEPLSPHQQGQMGSLARSGPGESSPARVVRGHYAEAERTQNANGFTIGADGALTALGGSPFSLGTGTGPRFLPSRPDRQGSRARYRS